MSDDKGSSQKASSYSFSGRKNNLGSTAEDLLSNLDEVKNRVFRTFEETTPSKFRTFFKVRPPPRLSPPRSCTLYLPSRN